MILLLEEIRNSFLVIEAQFKEDALEEFIKCNYCDLYNYHFGLGMWIRNNLLTEDSGLLRAFEANAIIQLDDISMLLIELFYLHISYKNNIDNHRMKC